MTGDSGAADSGAVSDMITENQAIERSSRVDWCEASRALLDSKLRMPALRVFRQSASNQRHRLPMFC
eukprot:4238734-Pleurochrysis_carterae.AAC.10